MTYGHVAAINCKTAAKAAAPRATPYLTPYGPAATDRQRHGTTPEQTRSTATERAFGRLKGRCSAWLSYTGVAPS